MSIRSDIVKILQENNVLFESYQHPAVFTVAEAKQHCSHIPGHHCKNLLLTDGHKHFLAVLPADKKADLRALAEQVDALSLRLAPIADVQRLLGVEPGSVSPLCLLATKAKVTILIDRNLRGIITFHPGDNGATITMERSDLDRILKPITQIINF